MKKFLLAVGLIALMGVYSPVMADSNRKQQSAKAAVVAQSQGFYKDVFMDSGIALTSRRELPAAPFLGLTMEMFVSSVNRSKPATKLDSLIQTKVMVGAEYDTNGILLYPDGAPRYRMIYMNGGSASKHGDSLFEEGRSHIADFVAGGGSYLGTCAGAYLASAAFYSPDGLKHEDIYLGLWPSYVCHTNLRKSYTAMSVPKKSPLLRYFDFGKDGVVAEVYHNGGCYPTDCQVKPFPKGMEILSHYIFNNTDKVCIDGEISAWAYKEDKHKGRVVLCGSHPEGVEEGERREYMAAMMLYAIEGNGTPQAKGTLKAGEVREMNKRTEDKAPAYTRIGDKQYHHFVVDVPKGCKRVVVTLAGYEGENNFDLALFGKRGELAFSDNATYATTASGCDKELVIEKPKAGKWYVSVHCLTTVTTNDYFYGTEYSGRLDVLNGVPYKIGVKFE